MHDAPLSSQLTATSLRGTQFGRAYADLVDDWLAGLLGETEGVAVAAVGGYGRRELAPQSDFDVVLLHDKVRGIGEIADRLWYPIWDQGFRLDHSVRTPSEALTIAGRELKVALGLLDIRCVAGETRLVDELRAKALAQWGRDVTRWITQLEADCRARHESPGPVAFVLEPDLKLGAGGLRDVTVLRALAAGLDVVELEPQVDASAAMLFDVRVALQRASARRDDRLLLEDQDAVAASLGLGGADDLMREVAGAGRTVAWQLDEAWRSARSALAGPRGRSYAGRDVPVADGLVLRDGEIALAPGAAPACDPALLVRVAQVAASEQVPISRTTMLRLVDEAPRLDDVWSSDAREALVGLFATGHAAVRVFETLDQYDLVTRILPEWEAVRSRPQRNAFHRFTVDRHLVEAAAQASLLGSRVSRPDLLMIAAWLHDLGKGFPGDHTDAGVTLMRSIATRIGYEPADVEVLVELVRHHLLLPAVASSRDLDDPATVSRVATVVGDTELLDLLATLTEADSIATGSTAWTPWKAGLVAGLVDRVRRELNGTPHVRASATPDADAELVERADSQLFVEGSRTHLVVVAPDQPGLFSRVVGLLALRGHDVRAARAWSVGETAMSEYDLEPHLGEVPDWPRFRDELLEALEQGIELDAPLARRAADQGRWQRPTAAHLPDPRVLVDNGASSQATVVEVHAVDEIGTLFRIAHALAELRLDIRHAKVSTLGPEVIDTFYVVTEDQKKVSDRAHLTQVEATILDAIAGGQSHIRADDSSD